MGTSKAALEWHGSTLVHRIAGIVARSVDGPVVVVRAPGQKLPPLPAGVVVAEDAREGHGPLEGLAAGLARVAEADVAYVSSTDVPLLHPAFVRRMLGAVTPGTDIAVPVVDGHRHPLAGAYRPSVAATVSRLLAAGESRLTLVLDMCRTVLLDARALLADPRLAAADPELQSIRNVNAPADYLKMRELPAPRISVEPVGRPSPPGGGLIAVHAATLAAAARDLGLPGGAPVTATLNGETVTWNEEMPLVDGDVVAFPRSTGT
jgi:molybdopterin-guanine dinucleotide biosynthesis protein A